MSKRSWHDANLGQSSASPVHHNVSIASLVSPAQSGNSDSLPESPRKVRITSDGGGRHASTSAGKAAQNGSPSEQKLPSISRKVKACAACRKQKIKCIMLGDPPCQRCKERGLSCRLNKSLQTLMSEDSRWKSFVTKDIATVYGSLEKVLQALSLPPLPALYTSAQEPAMFFDLDDAGNNQDDDESHDNSPKVTPVTENLSHVPIESLYQITGLRSLRAQDGITDDQKRICKQLRDTDFISRGLIQMEDAEYLANFYLNKLDPYIWHLAGDYADLEAFRRRSPTLTACILTVAALHDTVKSHLYPTCNKEYRRLVANAMFERRIDMEYLRALVIGSYWLSDISWTLSGYAVRRSCEFNLRNCYNQIVDSISSPQKYTQDELKYAMDGIRLLYLLYISDHHLSILYGRSSIMRDNETHILGWKSFLACPLATDSDKRTASQLALAHLMNRIREGLRPEDTMAGQSASALPKIAEFERDLDDWVSTFSQHNPSRYIGNWPSKGVIIHYHFAKLYLDSTVLRGLSETQPMIPDHFLETASAALASATSVVNLLLEDKDLQAALPRVPHYFHGMIAFACMFLLKVATKHSEQLYVDMVRLRMLISGLAQQLRATEVGKEHLVHRMADGLEKIAEMLGEISRQRHLKHDDANGGQVSGQNEITGFLDDKQPLFNGQAAPAAAFDAMDANVFGFGDSAIGLGMPFFDFEGTSLGGIDQPMFPYVA